MAATEIKKGIYWVGAIDWTLRDFHGYTTEKGSTYNAYLLVDEKVTLFDTVKLPYAEEMLARIREIIDPSRIDYVVVNHAEMDHSGSLPLLCDLAHPEKIFCSGPCVSALTDHFHKEMPLVPVKEGDAVSTGKHTIRFIETKMLHWPESMFSYIPEEKLLISSDAFGQHYATSERFDDEVDASMLEYQAAKYYANILLPYSQLVTRLLEKIGKLGIEIDMIAPDHGLIWRKAPQRALALYAKWAAQEMGEKAVIAYDTMWHSTELMANAFADGLVSAGMSVQVMGMAACNRSDVITELMDARLLGLGSPTLNNSILPRMADLLCYIKGLRPAKRKGFSFGSYGWGGEAVGLLNKGLEEMHFELAHPGYRIRYVPTREDLDRCRQLGRAIARGEAI